MIGYDPFNDPKASSYYTHPENFYDAQLSFDQSKLLPLYQRIFETWENHDSNQVMMFQGSTAPNILNKMGGIVNPLGFQNLPGGDKNDQKQAVNIKMSCCLMDTNACQDGEPLLSNEYACMHFHQKLMT